MKGNAPMNTMKPVPGESNSYNPKEGMLPGNYAKEQLDKDTYGSARVQLKGRGGHKQTELQKALASEASQHSYWEEWQGVTPGKPVYANPREIQDTMQPAAKYGTEGQGYA